MDRSVVLAWVSAGYATSAQLGIAGVRRCTVTTPCPATICRSTCRVVRVRACAEHPASSQSEIGDNVLKINRTDRILRFIEQVTGLFPVWVALGALLAACYPVAFLWFRPKYIVLTLAFIMAGMGLTLTFADFALAFSRPGIVLLGVASQYGIMPALGYSIAKLMRLPREIALGLILVAVCPGGAASNLVCLIGRADVALSVVLTMCSTVLSIIAIPTLMNLLAGQLVAIDAVGLLVSTVQVVLLPLCAGLMLKAAAPRAVMRTAKILPLISVIGVVLICGSIVAGTALSSITRSMVLALFILHSLGGVLGYGIARVFNLPVRSARTVSIEVMMQNSSLAVALALTHFASPLTAVPG